MNRPFIKILGTSAGGGLPQWNCWCRYCGMAREGVIPKRKQSSIALINDGKYTLVNASPDISQQLLYFEGSSFLRKNPMENIILTDAQLDHTLGLLQIREGEPLNIFATRLVEHQLSMEFPLLPLLEKYCSKTFTALELDVPFTPLQGITVTPVNITSNSPPYSSYRDKPTPGANIGLIINERVFYAPGLLHFTPEIKSIISRMEYLLLDGTCWSSDELSFINKPDLEDLGHISQETLIQELNGYSCKKVLIHINNTNPINDPDSSPSKILEHNGISVASDGMEIYL